MRRLLTDYRAHSFVILLSFGLAACPSSEPEESRLEMACRADYAAASKCGPVEVDEAEYVANCRGSEPEAAALLECRAMELEKDCDVERVGEVCGNEGD